MKVLMFGWEFPPFFSGGLGVACEGLTTGLSKLNVDITFVIPQGPENLHSDKVKLLVANNLPNYKIHVKKINSLLLPYNSEESYQKHYEKIKKTTTTGKLYGSTLYQEVARFTEIAKLLVFTDDFDIIHCHDWMTFPAGVAAKKLSGIPLILHVHATEFDRTAGQGANPYVFQIEKESLEYADKIIAVSNYTKQKIIENYNIPADKIAVVHNAVAPMPEAENKIKSYDKIVLFYGRLTIQKGPDYFIEAAKRVLDFDPNVKFIVAGTGDMESRLINRAAELGIGSKVLFTGFISKDSPEGRSIYQMADVYVFPSVSEPFGIMPLEALQFSTPVLISKQSGVSEILRNALKVDFWDIDELSNLIISVLNYKALHNELKHHGSLEVKTINWDAPAKKCLDVYNRLLNSRHLRPIVVR